MVCRDRETSSSPVSGIPSVCGSAELPEPMGNAFPSSVIMPSFTFQSCLCKSNYRSCPTASRHRAGRCHHRFTICRRRREHAVMAWHICENVVRRMPVSRSSYNVPQSSPARPARCHVRIRAFRMMPPRHPLLRCLRCISVISRIPCRVPLREAPACAVRKRPARWLPDRRIPAKRRR